jgi:regulatory protein
MPRLTAIRELERDRVALELDGRPWRIVPADAVVRAALRPGVELDRPRLRVFRRALREAVAVDVAMRTLTRRDAPRAELDAKLARRGVDARDRSTALDQLTRLGAVDDARFAASRARHLAEAEWGDAAIRNDLEERGVGAEAIDGAVAALLDEASRASAILTRRGRSPKTAARLARRGFPDDVVADATGEPW